MKELDIAQMEQIEGGGWLACLGTGLVTIGIGLSGPIGWAAFGFLATGSAVLAYEVCFD